MKYEQRIIDVEHSTFNPLVFACTGGAGPSASNSYLKTCVENIWEGTTAIPTQLASFVQKSVLHFYRARYYAWEDVAPLSVK